jgi:hypothetical protein
LSHGKIAFQEFVAVLMQDSDAVSFSHPVGSQEMGKPVDAIGELSVRESFLATNHRFFVGVKA